MIRCVRSFSLSVFAILLLIGMRNVTTARAADGDASLQDQKPARKNVLFIAVDDLRPEIACYGMPKLVTPHLDRLASRGVRFDRAYCNIAVCGASRASLMKGLRPTPTRFTSYLTRADKDAADVPSLPRLLKQNGYTTLSNGKVYHHTDDDREAWSEAAWRPQRSSLWWAKPENRPERGSKLRGPAFEAADVDDAEYPDHQVCDKTLSDMQRLSKTGRPFFLACGFYRPHLPFVAPKKYWDKYPADKVQLPDNMDFPKDLSTAFRYNWGEMRSYRDIPKKGPVSEETARNLIRGYHACVSFIDAQVGRLLDELDRLGIADDTIIVLWGDHGWQLGEHGFWCKHTNFEVATRTPLLVVAPGMPGERVCRRMVEYVDIYPTVCDLAGVPLPTHLHGKSLRPLLTDVDAKFKDAVFTRHGGGEAVRTSEYRYMEMRTKNGAGQLQGVGLFDLRKDPAENHDVSNDPAYADVRKRLRKMLQGNRDRITTK